MELFLSLVYMSNALSIIHGSFYYFLLISRLDNIIYGKTGGSERNGNVSRSPFGSIIEGFQLNYSHVPSTTSNAVGVSDGC